MLDGAVNHRAVYHGEILYATEVLCLLAKIEDGI